jgi:hypothetical protein
LERRLSALGFGLFSAIEAGAGKASDLLVRSGKSFYEAVCGL